VTFSPLEERLVGPERRQAIMECQQMLDIASVRLQSEASGHQSVSRFKRFEAARLAIAAASEVVSAIRSASIEAAPNPYQSGPEQIRGSATRNSTS